MPKNFLSVNASQIKRFERDDQVSTGSTASNAVPVMVTVDWAVLTVAAATPFVLSTTYAINFAASFVSDHAGNAFASGVTATFRAM